MSFSVLAAVTACFAESTAAPANEQLGDQVLKLASFEVQADRVPAADNSEIEERRMNLTEPFTGVTREEFGRRANRRAGDIVARISGMFMGGPPGENKDARGRGLDKEYTRAQVDGLAIPDGGEKRELQLNRIPADLIQEVRVLRNPAPELESDGLAARLDFRFRPIPKEKFFGELRAAWGARNRTPEDRRMASLTAGGRPVDEFGWMLSFNFLDDPTYKEKTEETFSAAGVKISSVPETEIKPSKARDLFVDTAWFYPNGELHLKPLRLDLREPKEKTKTTFDLTKASTADETLELERENKHKLGEGLSLLHEHNFMKSADGQGYSLDSRASWQRITEQHLTPKTVESYKESAGKFTLNKTTRETENKADLTKSIDSKYSATLADGSHLLKVGFAYRERDRERVKSKFETTGTKTTETTGVKDNYSMDEDYLAFFVQDTWRPSDHLSILGGARGELVDFSSRTPSSEDAKHRFQDFNPNAQALYKLRPDTALKFAVSRSLNRPKFDELSPYEQVTSSKVTLGNPDLQPAKSWNFDLGIDHRQKDLFLAANVYHKQISGVIESIEDGSLLYGLPVTQVQNVGDGTLQGLELEQRVGFAWTRLSFLRTLTLWSNQTWIRSELREYSGKERRFSGQPSFLGHVGMDYEIGRLYLSCSLQHVGQRPADEASADKKEQMAENTVDASLHLRLAKGLSLFAEGNNLTDEYKDERTLKTTGVRTRKIERTGRALFVGVKASF